MAFFTTGAQLQAAINALPTSKKGGFNAFDGFFYGGKYLVNYSGTLSPLEHFVQIGADRGFAPNAQFDPVYYKAAYTDLASANLNAADLLFHFLQFGLDEGRAPNATLAGFNGTAYLAANPDVATFVNANLAQFGGSASNGALAHFVKFGQFEGRTEPGASTGNSFNLTVGQDTVNGTASNDTFTARIFDNQNTLQSGDAINGGTGSDTLVADIGNSQNFAITPEINSVETVKIRVQADQRDSGDNNIAGVGIIDAERSVGVTHWESNNSRADLIVEDVRIAASQITKDITIAMVETDPGEVDFGVYFDQYSLRAQTNTSSTITLQLMDTRSNAAGTAPLQDSPYSGFAFNLTAPGATGPTLITLTSEGIDNAQTYVELVAAINAAIAARPELAAFSARLGGNFTVSDTLGSLQTGTEVVLTANDGSTVSAEGVGTGWIANGAVPPSSGLHTFISTARTNTTDLVTSTIVLDDVGRGSNGGDLVVGGLSTGATSGSLGVQRFEIEVRDNSSVQTINSTNNTLREVTIKNGVTSNNSFAYRETVKDAGNLTVNGRINPVNTTDNAPLPGSANQHNAFGFSDVRLIDGSAMTGQLAFTSEITAASIAKYLNLRDIQALPAGDNVAFQYTGGGNNDTLNVQIDGGVVSSRSTIVAGREDFTFTADGGAGNDTITVSVVNGLAGGAQAWYNNQKLNANISINGGDGNDTIRTPGAGDVKINAGAGDDVVYTDNTGALNQSANATGFAGPAATAFINAYKAEAATAQAAAIASNTTGFVRIDGTEANGSAYTSTAAAAAALNVLDLVTPTVFDVATVPVHSALVAAINAATAAGGLTFAQNIALNAAYGNTATAATISPSTAYNVDSSLTGFVATPDATVVTAAQFAAGNALLESYTSAAKAAAAQATSNDTNVVTQTAFLNATQVAVLNAEQALNRVADPVNAVTAGSQQTVANLAALQTALNVGATDAQVAAALQTAVDKGALSDANATTIYAVVAGAGTLSTGEIATIALTLTPLVAAANNTNTANQATLAAAIAADKVISDGFATAVSADAAGDGVIVANNVVGSADAATAQNNALGALTAFNTATLNPLTAQSAGLAALKAAILAGSTELEVSVLTQNAVAAGTITAGQKTTIDTAAGALAPAVGQVVSAAEKIATDVAITALQLPVETLLADATLDAANLTATLAAATTAATIALAATNSGGNSLTIASPRAVFVFNTADQSSTYNRAIADERNLADLKSDANNSSNFFNASVRVTYQGLEATVLLAGTGFKTTDLELNQAIKAAINSDPVLNKLLIAADGPANTLVVRSLIDGVHTTADLAVSVTLPLATALTPTDVAGAAAAYGLPVGASTADVLAAMTAAKTAFDAKGDYTTQFAESGAAGGNVNLAGANSTSSSDNTVTGGAGNDVIVLGTTVGTDGLTSSNETVVYATGFGNDTIVNFAETGLGRDTLDFTALKGSGAAAFGSLSADKSIVVAAQTLANDTALEIAALFTDSATAINHVYVAYDANNVGKVYMVADAAGVAAGNVTAVLVGTIDLADTGWATLTAANFA